MLVLVFTHQIKDSVGVCSLKDAQIVTKTVLIYRYVLEFLDSWLWFLMCNLFNLKFMKDRSFFKTKTIVVDLANSDANC